MATSKLSRTRHLDRIGGRQRQDLPRARRLRKLISTTREEFNTRAPARENAMIQSGKSDRAAGTCAIAGMIPGGSRSSIGAAGTIEKNGKQA
jgi:hypothetical protein